MFDVVKVEHGSRVQSEPSRDSRRSEFGKVTLSDRHLPPGESLLGRLARAAAGHGGAAVPHNIGNLWFMPATASPASSICGTGAPAGRGGGPVHPAEGIR